jgi:hypothetical protein
MTPDTNVESRTGGRSLGSTICPRIFFRGNPEAEGLEGTPYIAQMSLGQFVEQSFMDGIPLVSKFQSDAYELICASEGRRILVRLIELMVVSMFDVSSWKVIVWSGDDWERRVLHKGQD